MKFKYLKNMYVCMVLTQDTYRLTQDTAACSRDKFTMYTHDLYHEVPAVHILVCIYVFVHAACCCEMFILQFDPLCVSQFLCFMHLVVFVTSYICYSLSQPAKGAR